MATLHEQWGIHIVYMTDGCRANALILHEMACILIRYVQQVGELFSVGRRVWIVDCGVWSVECMVTLGICYIMINY